MTSTQQTVVMVFGALIALAGLVFYFYRKEEGKNRVQVLGQEFEVSTPALVIFLAGCLIFVLPFVVPASAEQRAGPVNGSPTPQDTLRPPLPSPPITSAADTTVMLEKGRTQGLVLARGRDTLRVEFDEVETLKGRGTRVERGYSGHEFNKRVIGRRAIGAVLARAGIDTTAVLSDVMAMDTGEWINYLESLPSALDDRIKDMRLARLKASVNGANTLDAYFVAGDAIELSHPSASAVVEVRDGGKQDRREWVHVRAVLKSRLN